MLTPRFKLSQSDSVLVVEIHAPYVNIKGAEYFSKDYDFRFVAIPYFLRLNLPGRVVETEESNVHYDVDKGDFIIRLQKAEPGQVFEGLDLLSVLLAPAPQSNLGPKVSLVADESELIEEEGEDWESGDEWFLDQKLPEDLPVSIATNLHGYGFANKHTGLFKSHEIEMLEIVDIRDADHKSQAERRTEREKRELEDFSEDHYLADFMDPPSLVLNALKMSVPYSDGDSAVTLSKEEEETLLQLPRKSYLINKDQKKVILLTAVSLVYSWAYDRRVTEGEHCVESGWAIAKVSPVISYFECDIQKKDMNLDLEELETAAKLVAEEEAAEMIELTQHIAKMKMESKLDDSDDDTSTSSFTSDSDDSSSDSDDTDAGNNLDDGASK